MYTSNLNVLNMENMHKNITVRNHEKKVNAKL